MKKEPDLKEEVKIENEIAETNSIADKIERARDKLAVVDAQLEETSKLITKIDYNKGIVMASTKDFQESCVSILKKEQMLTKVVREVERNLQMYKDYEECTRIMNTSQILDQPKELVAIMHKIERGISFFRENFEYKKAELYLRRFEGLRHQVLESKFLLKIVKIMRELNSEITLRVVQTRLLETATHLSEIESRVLLYTKATAKTQESLDSLRLLMSVLEGNKGDFGEFCEVKIY